METLLKRIDERVADRNTIAQAFGTDSLTTHRILSNLCSGFCREHFVNFDEMWKEAHPFECPAHPSRDYRAFDIEFIRKHFNLFASKQFWTGGGWAKEATTNSEGKRVIEWEYRSGYRDEEIVFENKTV